MCCTRTVLAAVLVGWACTTLASAGVLSNVAFEKTAAGTEYYSSSTGVTYLASWAVDGSRETFSHGVGSPDGVNNWWEVDLGQVFDLSAVRITCRALQAARTNGATLRVLGDDGVTQIGENLVLSGFVNAGTYDFDTRTFDNGGAGWSGARYLMVGGEGLGVNYMHLAEVEALVDLPAYSGFLAGVTATANNAYSTHPAIYGPQFLTNGSTMSDQGGPAVGDPTATCKEINAGVWMTTIDPAPGEPTVTFDLGGTFALGRMLLWNYNVPTLQNRGLKEVVIETSLDGTAFTPLDDRNGDELGNYTVPISPGGYAGYQGDVDLTGVNAAYVRITAWSNHAADTSGHWYYGLNEVRFYGSGSTTPHAGDANSDGKVDDLDASILAANWQRTGDATWATADFNTDGNVNDLDASILAANWQYGVGAAVPEPGGLVLVVALLGAVAGLVRRRHGAGC